MVRLRFIYLLNFCQYEISHRLEYFSLVHKLAADDPEDPIKFLGCQAVVSLAAVKFQHS